MYNNKKPPEKFIHRQVIPVQQEDPERSIAFFLENSQPGDPRVLELLLDFYAHDVYRLVQALLDDNWRSPVDEKEIFLFVDQVFIGAMEKRDEFLGQESLRNWLFAITTRAVRRYRLTHNFQRFQRFIHKKIKLTPSEEYKSLNNGESINEGWEFIDNLKSSQRDAIILHYLFDLSDDEVASILGKKLTLWENLLTGSEISLFLPPGENPTKSQSEISAALNFRWPRPDINLSNIYERVNGRLLSNENELRSKLFNTRYAEAVILFLVTMTVLAGISILNSKDEAGGRPLFPPTPGPLPEPIEVMSSNVIDLDLPTDDQPGNPALVLFSTEPDLSKNGNYLVFTSSIGTFLPGDRNDKPDVYVLNLKSNTMQRVSISSNGSGANESSYSPRISADGRYVVFSSVANNLVDDDLNICNWYGADISCMDIYIHDAETKQTERISVADDGQESDNNSYYPVISADGRWVAYWSEATNLTADSNNICDVGDRAGNCINLYIYDRVTRSTKLIPIGRRLGFGAVEPVSISGNGQYLSLTILSTDQIAENLRLLNQSEVYVFDTQNDSFTPVNIDNLGNAGNAESDHPRISSDGRYVAFTSLADNLTHSDRNGQSDVFLRDRIEKSTQLISKTQEGSPGNASSGSRTIPGIAGWGQQISISDDGRYVVFTSHADNLSKDMTESCGHPGKSVCVNVYLFDRVTNLTELILPGRGLDSFYANVQISGDGRRVAIVDQFIRCTDKDICSQLWLYDVEKRSVELPLRNQYQFPGERSNWPYVSFGQGSTVNAIAFSPDGSIFATGANDSTIKMWDLNGSPRGIIHGHRLPVTDVEFSEAGFSIISSSQDGCVKVWDKITGMLTDELIKHNSAILGLAISPDGKKLAAGGVGQTWIWNKIEGRFILAGSFLHPGIFVSDLAFSPDGGHLAMAMSDGTVWVKNVGNQETVLRLGGHEDGVLDVTFSPDGKFLASGSKDHTLNLWQITLSNDKSPNVQHIASVKHPNWVSSVNFSQDGNLLASVSLGDKVYVWDMTKKQPLRLLLRISHDEVMSLDFSADSQTIAAGTIGGNIHLWHLSDLEVEQ